MAPSADIFFSGDVAGKEDEKRVLSMLSRIQTMRLSFKRGSRGQNVRSSQAIRRLASCPTALGDFVKRHAIVPPKA